MDAIIKENRKEVYYRGYYGHLGVHNPEQSFIWLSEDENYARMYGDKLASFEVNTLDYSKIADFYEIENLLECFNEKVGIDYDSVDMLYMPTEEFVVFLKEKGNIGYLLNDDCLCLLDKKLLDL